MRVQHQLLACCCLMPCRCAQLGSHTMVATPAGATSSASCYCWAWRRLRLACGGVNLRQVRCCRPNTWQQHERCGALPDEIIHNVVEAIIDLFRAPQQGEQL